MGLGPLLWVGTCCSGRDLRLVMILGSLDFQVPRFLARLRITLDPFYITNWISLSSSFLFVFTTYWATAFAVVRLLYGAVPLIYWGALIGHSGYIFVSIFIVIGLHDQWDLTPRSQTAL